MNSMECVIFIGIQGAGKSTFYKENFFKTHIRINIDMLKTRNREKILIEACIEAKQSFVIDNTNPDSDSRINYIKIAKNAGFKIISYYFDIEYKTALDRNNKRTGKEKIPEIALISTSKKIQIPIYAEGFDDIYTVFINDENRTEIKKEVKSDEAEKIKI